MFNANSNGTFFGLVGNTPKNYPSGIQSIFLVLEDFFLHCRPQTIQCSAITAISECSYVDRSNTSAVLGSFTSIKDCEAHICPTSMTGVSLASPCFAVSV